MKLNQLPLTHSMQMTMITPFSTLHAASCSTLSVCVFVRIYVSEYLSNYLLVVRVVGEQGQIYLSGSTSYIKGAG